jgi:hypothetical protein
MAADRSHVYKKFRRQHPIQELNRDLIRKKVPKAVIRGKKPAEESTNGKCHGQE